MIPIAGSAYSYAYATLGELVAWIIGWDLILEYAVAASRSRVGWSGYFRNDPAHSSGIDAPGRDRARAGHRRGRVFNLPALLVILAVVDAARDRHPRERARERGDRRAQAGRDRCS